MENRPCAYCGKPLEKKLRRDGKRLESDKELAKRNYCDRVCAGKHRVAKACNNHTCAPPKYPTNTNPQPTATPDFPPQNPKLADPNLTPLDYMLIVMRDPDNPPDRRDWAAKEAAKYCHKVAGRSTKEKDEKKKSSGRFGVRPAPLKTIGNK